VKGSPLQVETLERAAIMDAKIAIILCTSPEDTGSDGKVASVLTIIEHIHPEIKTIAECLDERHQILFHSTSCDSVVYSNQVINNILVQETQDSGVSSLVTELTDNGQGFTLYSTSVTSEFGKPYKEIASRMRPEGTKLISVEREGKQILNWEAFQVEKGDRVIYIAEARMDWSELL